MKKILPFFVFAMATIAIALSSCTTKKTDDKPDLANDSVQLVNLLTERATKQQLSNKKQWQMICGDFNNDERYELVAVTPDVYAKGEESIEDQVISVYYVTDDGVKRIIDYFTTMGYNNPHAITTDEGTLITIPEGCSITSWCSLNILITKNGCEQLESTPLLICDAHNNMFIEDASLSAFKEGTMLMGRCTQYYPVYMKNNKLHEYGGIAITTSQLNKCKGIEDINKRIEDLGGKITDCYYRENDFIDINYSVKTDDGYSNYCIACQLEGKEIVEREMIGRIAEEYDPVYGFHGIVKAQLNKEIATYPKKFKHK